jgi:hypothetical protein
MNLTNEEAQEINRRVAVKLGWRWLRTSKPGNRVYHADFKRPCDVAPCVDWVEWTATEEEAYADALKAGDNPYWGVPDFCTDPAAADLVRVEIERRGWDWDTQGYTRDGGTRFYSVTIGRMGALRNMFQRGRSEVSPHHALCLAFLAACEAEERPT